MCLNMCVCVCGDLAADMTGNGSFAKFIILLNAIDGIMVHMPYILMN